MDVAALRAEIKAWERDFKVDNGRDPTIRDIKDRPDLAEKYKLYKKLNKAKTQPSTPPKRHSRQLISKSQAVIIEPPTASVNPFSPVKNKGSGVLRVEQTRPLSNPSSTPQKEAKSRELSPDLFPLIQPVASSSQVTPPSQPASAISRARKRLRGERVSPSPVKPKRPRVVPVGGPIPFIAKRPSDSDEDHDCSDDGISGQTGPAFFEETPRKDRSGDKPFASLFNEDERLTKPNFSLATTQSLSGSRMAAGPGIFTKTLSQGARVFLSQDDDPAKALPHAQIRSQLRIRRKPKPSDTRADAREKAFNISSRLTSSKGNNLLDQDIQTLRLVTSSATSGTKSSPSTAPSTPDHGVSKLPPTSSAPTSEAEMGDDSDSIDNRGSKLSLVPVSPPPPSLTSTNGYGNWNARGKGKGKMNFTSGAGRWKGKGKSSTQTDARMLVGEDSHGDDFDDGSDLPVIRIYQGRNAASKLDGERGALDDIHCQVEEVTEDLVSGIKRRITSSDPDLSFVPPQIQTQDGDMVVNLRDEFRMILDLNANAAPLETVGSGVGIGGRGEYVRHARVVRAVRDGTRVIGMFDPTRGGHIWGVGETEHEADADLGTEDFQLGLECGGGGYDDYDDWEGEGVPWEVAELEHDDDETRL